jgi:hypothetical protein
LIYQSRSLIHLVPSSSRLGASKLLGNDRSALFTEALVRVPADLFANPGAASVALDEQGLYFLNCILESVIVTRSAYSPLYFVRGVARAAEYTSKEAACSPKEPSSHAKLIGNE